MSKASKKQNKPDETKIDGQMFHLKPSDITVPEIRARAYMDEDALNELIESIKHQGIIEPLVVTEGKAGWILVAGERRLRAAQKANLQKVPVISRPYTPAQALYAELSENLNRADGDPISEAFVMQTLEQRDAQTHGQIAKTLGKSRVWVTNRIRLLDLHPSVQSHVMHNRIDASSALELLQLEDKEAQKLLGDNITENKYTRDTVRSLVRGIIAAAAQAGVTEKEAVEAALMQAEQTKQQKPLPPISEEQQPDAIPEQPRQQPPAKELCHGCETVKPTSDIQYRQALCSDCNIAALEFLHSRKQALKQAGRKDD